MSLSTGQKVGPYEVLSSLGAGGMGEVYRARDSSLGREVALKTLDFGLAKMTLVPTHQASPKRKSCRVWFASKTSRACEIFAAWRKRSYDDRFVVLYKDEGGNKRVQIFEGATHTGQKSVASDKREDGTYRAKFTDVSGDGKSDIAYIQPGTYDFHLGKSKKYGDHLRPDQNISAWRDTNQDGKITGKELDQNHSAKAILFHKGGTEAPRSVGCQTMEPNEFDNFMELIKKDPNDKVSYTLVDASK